MDHDEMRRVGEARVGRLATVRADGTPHVVVCCFALSPERPDTLWTVVDGKPKSTPNLQRIRNLEANPHASLLVDHYDDCDWAQLWWVRVDGVATVHHDVPLPQPLRDKYAQYRDQPPRGPLIRLTIDRWTAWESRPKRSSENL